MPLAPAPPLRPLVVEGATVDADEEVDGPPSAATGAKEDEGCGGVGEDGGRAIGAASRAKRHRALYEAIGVKGEAKQ